MWDIIKSSVVQRFDGSISVWQMVLSLGLSLVAGIFILFIYKRTMRRVAVSSSFQTKASVALCPSRVWLT